MPTLTIASIAALFVCNALAAETIIRDLPDNGSVSVTGTVDKVRNGQEFTLRDNSGTVAVKTANTGTALPKPGDNVMVSGIVEDRMWGLMGKDIKASSIQVVDSSDTNSRNRTK